MSPEPKIVDVEVVREPPRVSRRLAAAPGPGSGGPPIHPLAALLLLAVDNLWLLPEFVVIDWVITIPLCFITVFIPTLLIQKLVKKQRTWTALGYALLLAVIAAVPTSLLGTPLGAALLAWFGISRLWSGGRGRTVP
ncbi:MAG: hypothetical protein MUE94_01325 [Verrucomicrobia bacterium]|jgi:hypothetical protein|nr:hypothetical protein [Verrucomicrobiota bacterium]